MTHSFLLEEDEVDIIAACVRQESWAQQILYESHFGVLMGVSLRYAGSYDEALDVLHDAFIKIFDKIDSYNEGTSLSSWMKRIVVNTAIDNYRKKKLRRTENIDNVFEMTSSNPNPVDKIQEKELIQCIQSLPPAYRAVFNMSVIDGMSHKEIGERLGVSEATSRSNLVKARKKLQSFIKARYKIQDK